MIKQTVNTGRTAQKITQSHLHCLSSIPNVTTIVLPRTEDINKAANADNSTKMQQGEERAPASRQPDSGWGSGGEMICHFIINY